MSEQIIKTLVINGSPRVNGDTVALISELQKNLHSETTVIHTYSVPVQPCTDCRFCWTTAACALQDNMQDIFHMIDCADTIVIASPLHFSQLSGSLLQFASRLQYLWVSKNIRHEAALRDKKRNGFVFLTGGGDGSPEPAAETAKCLLHHMGATYLDCVYSLHTNTTPAKEDVAALNKVRAIAQRIGREQ